MRKRIVMTVIFVFIAVTVYINSFLQEKNKNYLKFTQIGQSENAFQVIFSTEIKDDHEIYETIKTALKLFRANLYCSSVEKLSENEIYTKYILVNREELFNALPLKKGRFFAKDELESDLYLSTVCSENVSQIGVMSHFDKNMEFEIRTMKVYIEHQDNAFQKMFILELENTEDFEILRDTLREEGIFMSKASENDTVFDISFLITLTAFLATFVLMLILFYDLIKSYKQIGVEKMLGYDSFAIWESRVLPVLVLEGIIFFIIAFGLSLFLFDELNSLIWKFMGKLAVHYIIIMTLTLIIISVPFLYVENIPVYAAIKNQKPLKSLTWFNLIVKCVVTILLIIVISNAFTQMQRKNVQTKSRYENWDKLKSYAYIYTECYYDEYFDDFAPENIEKWKSAYLEFNSQGGIMADFTQYSPLYEEEQKAAEFPAYYDVTVNPNYLNLFEVKDINGERVCISEKDKNYILLVPQKYKQREQEILAYYEDIVNDDKEISGERKNPKIKIIWLQNSQKLFSMALDIGIDEGNTVEDPLIVVLTEENGDAWNYANVAASTGNPFKIKVQNVSNLQLEIDTVMSKYFDLEEIWFPSVGVYQSVEAQIAIANELLIFYSAVLMVLATIAIAIIMQDAITYIRRYQRILAIQKILGYRLVDKYKHFFCKTGLCYILSVMIAIVIKQDIDLLLFAGILLGSDLIFSYIYIYVKDRKDVIQITKGGL